MLLCNIDCFSSSQDDTYCHPIIFLPAGIHHEHHSRQTWQWIPALEREHGLQFRPWHDNVQPPPAGDQLHPADRALCHAGPSATRHDPEEGAWLAWLQHGHPGRPHGLWGGGRLRSHHGHQAGEAVRARLSPADLPWGAREEHRAAGGDSQQQPQPAGTWPQRGQCE